MFSKCSSLYRGTVSELNEGSAGFNIHCDRTFYVLLDSTYRNGCSGHNDPPFSPAFIYRQGKIPSSTWGVKSLSRALGTCLTMSTCNLPAL